MEIINNNGDVPVLRPTEEEFNKGINYYVNVHMYPSGCNKYGIAKVIPPKSWTPNAGYQKQGYQNDVIDNIKIAQREQIVDGHGGVYTKDSLVKMNQFYSVKQYRTMAQSDERKPPVGLVGEKVDTFYWANIENKKENEPVYGKEVHGSLFDQDQDTWNLNKLDTPLRLAQMAGIANEGITSSYIYFGMYGTTFAWHTEDRDLHSINYHHYGANKVWYNIPVEQKHKLKSLIEKYYPETTRFCDDETVHRRCLMSPEFLKKQGITCYRTEQCPGEFIITFPNGYHSGYNTGYNINEAVNFASTEWISKGIVSEPCVCNDTRQDLPMAMFVKALKPELYDSFMRGKMNIQLDHNAPTATAGDGYIGWEEDVLKNLKKFNEGREHKMNMKEFLLDIVIPDSDQQLIPVDEGRVHDSRLANICELINARHEDQKRGFKISGVSKKKTDQLSVAKTNYQQGEVFPHCHVCRTLLTNNQQQQTHT